MWQRRKFVLPAQTFSEISSDVSDALNCRFYQFTGTLLSFVNRWDKFCGTWAKSRTCTRGSRANRKIVCVYVFGGQRRRRAKKSTANFDEIDRSWRWRPIRDGREYFFAVRGKVCIFDLLGNVHLRSTRQWRLSALTNNLIAPLLRKKNMIK